MTSLTEPTTVAAGRVLLVVAASGAVLAGAPTPMTAVLSLLAMVLTGERLARTRGRSRVDTALLGAGGALVTLILVGLLLGVSGIGLRPAGWAIALGVTALLGLGAAEYTDRRRPATPDEPVDPADPADPADSVSLADPVGVAHPAGPAVPDGTGRWSGIRVRNLPWALAVVAVIAGALTVSVRATDRADVAPLQMAFGTVQEAEAQVVVSADRASGPLELRTEAEDGTSLSYPLIQVEPGRPMTASVVLPRTGRFVITLNNPDQTEPLRSLILDR